MCKKEQISLIICDKIIILLISFMHDTHFDPKLEKFVTAEWDFTSYFCLNNTRSRGVAILVNNKFEFKVQAIF